MQVNRWFHCVRDAAREMHHKQIGTGMKLLKSAEVSAKVRVPEETLRYWRWRSEGPRSFKVGKAVVYDEADVDAWLAEQRAKSLRGGGDAA